MTDLSRTGPSRVVRTPGSSANLGAGFDVYGMAVDLFADVGEGPAPDNAQALEPGHPGRIAFDRAGGEGPVWIRTNIPMARGLGFSGAVRVGGACLAVVRSGRTISEETDRILALTAELEGHGDNVAASLHGGVVAYIGGRAVPFVVGPNLAGAAFVAWVPGVTTSTDASRQALGETVRRGDAVFNIARATQFALAFAHDDPALLVGSTDDRIHQETRLLGIPGGVEAMEAGLHAGAWCVWLSGSGPTVGMLTAPEQAERIAAALPASGHTKVLSIDTVGARLI